MWRTEESPARITKGDSVTEHQGILPPRNGPILRIIDFPPEPRDEGELKRAGDVLDPSGRQWANRSNGTARIAFVLVRRAALAGRSLYVYVQL